MNAEQTKAYLAQQSAIKRAAPEVAAAHINTIRAMLNAPEPIERLWMNMQPAERRYLCEAAGVVGIKARWSWRELTAAERTGIVSAIRRAADWAQTLQAQMRAGGV